MREPRIVRAAQFFLIAALFLGSAAHAWRGWYTRYVTDDYCTAGALRTMGVAEAMRYHRDHWSGRFSYYAIKAALESVGPVTARVVPGALFLLLFFAAWCALRQFVALPGVGAAAIAFATVDAAPEVFSLYGPFAWETGAITYMLPVVLFAFWVAVLLGRGAVVVSCIASGALMLIAGGLSETSLAAQGAMTGGTLILGLRHRSRRMTWIAATGLTATLVAFAIAYSAPGNALRARELPPRQSVTETVSTTTETAFDFIGSHLFVDGAALLVVLAAGLSTARISRATALQVAALAFLSYGATFVPAAWLLSTGPPARALQVSLFFFIVAVFVLSMLVHARPEAIAILLIIAAFVPIRSAWKTIASIPEARRNAAHVDAIDSELRTQRGRDAVLRSPWALEHRFLDAASSHWTNRCVARYFDLRSLRVERR